MKRTQEEVQTTLKWSGLLEYMDIGKIFENTPLKERSWILYLEDACEIIDFSAEEVTARVKGRTGIYRTSVSRKGTGLSFNCSCPSDYYPCKHAGALLYTLRDLCIERSGQKAIRPDVFTSSFDEHSFTPGEIVGVIEAANDEKRHFDVEKIIFGKEDSEERVGSISEDARFRPAFRLTIIRNPQHPIEQVLGIEPVLVYIRNDGEDGRLEKFSFGKKRLPGDEATEQLLRSCSGAAGRRKRAMEIVRIWYARSLRNGQEPFEPPVELYIERADRLVKEKHARLREVKRLMVRWSAERFRHSQIEYSPRIYIRDEAGEEEYFDFRLMHWERDAELFLLSNPCTGSIWYLFDYGLEQALASRVKILSKIFALPNLFGVHEARNFAEICRRRYSELIDVEELPEHIMILSIIPTPIVDFESTAPLHQSVDFTGNTGSTFLQLSFRYGQKYECPPGSRKLIRLSPKEVEQLTGLAPDSTDSLHYITPLVEAEDKFAHLLDSILTDQGFSLQAVDLMNPFIVNHRHSEANHESCQAPYFRVDCELYELIAAVGGDLAASGFEIRLQKEKVSRPPGPKAVRISSSGEEWLEIETGFETEEGFVPIENIHSRGIIEAGGKKYILPPGADVDTLLSRLRQNRIGRFDLAALEDILDELSNPEHPGLRDFLELREKLASFSGLEKTETPQSFNGNLRPYQQNGLSWLWFLHSYGLGGCLADDMGLGKTIQTLALLSKAREAGMMKRALVVCPVSTLGNWRHEIRTFTPHFSVLIHAGTGRAAVPEDLSQSDIVLAGYAILLRDVELLRQIDFDYLILDEAQALKNPKTKRRKSVASLDIPHRIALTGTPIENSVIELWSLLDLLMPGILGSRSSFSRRYGREIKESGLDRLRRIIHPLILRRTKRVVAPELPPKEVFVHYTEAGKRQAEVYESLRIHFADEVQSLIETGEQAKSAMKILEAMLRLRQAAILPALVDRDFSNIPSAKLDMLYDRIEELRSEDNKALVFSQFTGVLDEVQRRLTNTDMKIFRLDGSIPQKRRERDIAAFQACKGAAVFLISLKAGGLGINLTAADYVFLLDPWWNPSVESQAIDRAHRIGRRGPVFAYRLVTQGTIEEKMLRLQERKLSISDSLIRGESGALRELSNEDILELFRGNNGRPSA